MGYELSLDLKRGRLEIEFETLEELDEKLAKLDLARLNRILKAHLEGAKRAKEGAAKPEASAARKAKKGKGKP